MTESIYKSPTLLDNTIILYLRVVVYISLFNIYSVYSLTKGIVVELSNLNILIVLLLVLRVLIMMLSIILNGVREFCGCL